MTWQHISTEVTVKNFKKCCISNAADETDVICCGMAVKMETVKLIGEGSRENLTYSVLSV
jgi:hypothetical protein